MGLGKQLRNAIEKLRNSSAVDKDTVKEAVKELQRALISADVEVSLVLQLSKHIENEAFKDLPKGVSRREHVIKVLYDSLADAMGGTPDVPDRPKKIVLAGLFGSGKCIHPETIVPMPEGNISSIKEIYDKNQENELVLKDGFVKELSNPINVWSWDPVSMKMTAGKATHLWKLKKDKPLYKIILDNGNNHHITVTPEHPFIILEDSKIKQVKAEEIKLGQFVATPRLLNVGFYSNDMRGEIFKTTPDDWLISDVKTCKEVRSFLLEKYGTLINAFGQLSENYSYITFTANLKAGIIRFSILKKTCELGYKYEIAEQLKVAKSGSRAKTINLPPTMTPELAEFLGYFYADGHMRRQYLEIVNEEDAIIERIVGLGKKIFNVTPTIKKDERSENLRKVIFSSVLLTAFVNLLFGAPFNKKSDKIRAPRQVLLADAQAKKSFLQAYFDCDGYIAEDTRQIEFCTASRMMAEDLRVLLAGFGFVPNFSKKKTKGKYYYRICLKAKDVEIFAQEMGSKIKFKQERLFNCNSIGEGQTLGKQDMLHVGEKLKEIREFYGTTIGEVQKHVSSYGIYEKEGLISRNSLKKFLSAIHSTKNKNNEILKSVLQAKKAPWVAKELSEPLGWVNANVYRLKQLGLLEYSNGMIQITEKGKGFLEKKQTFDMTEIAALENLVSSDVAWVKVKKIELVDNTEYVYDLTVDGYHNFVANHVIVHNTTTTGKIAKWYAKRGMKVGVIAADTFRPAAYEQLEQVSKAAKVEFFGIRGEKNAAKVVREALTKMKGFDLLICDSAGRNALDMELVEEVKEIDRAFGAEEKWLVISADIGQTAKKQASAFHDAIGINGIIITKMDGSAKGGGALAACHATNSPVYFVGVGEKADDLQQFDAQRYLSRIMGYGDLAGLLEKIKEAQEEEEIDIEEIMDGEFTIETFYRQLKAARKIGPLNKIAEMMGFSAQIPKEMLEVGEEKLNGFKVMIDSMTVEERRNPDVLNKGRIARVARGSGKTQEQVRELIRQYRTMAKMFKQLKGLDEKKLQKGGLQGLFGKMKGVGKKKKLRFR